MRTLFFLIPGALFYQCTNNHSTDVNDRANQLGPEKKVHCIKEGGETFPFFLDDFSSEGADGKIFFENDTLIGKIQFSYATGMVYTEQEYWFRQNKLIKYKQINHHILPDKSGYADEDSVVVEGDHIFKNKRFSDKIFQKLLHTASDKNPCWEE
jgi:hypothetical protein